MRTSNRTDAARSGFRKAGTPAAAFCFFFTILFAACGGGGGGSSGSACVAAHDIPFSYSLGSDHIAIHTPGGILKTSIGPWGAHAMPHTGHENGDGKANWSGLFAVTFDELAELGGDADGICEKGELCGMPGAEIEKRIPTYLAPDGDFRIWSVLVEGKTTTYYGSDLQWRVEGYLCDVYYYFGHVRKISPGLRNRMIAAGYTDPWTVADVTGNLITDDPITLSKGDPICEPQIFALEVPGYPGYFRGGGTFPQTPWAQIEFGTRRGNSVIPFYSLLPEGLRSQLESILYADGSNPVSFRYDSGFVFDWLWKAEMGLWTVDHAEHDDFSTIYNHFGSWWETGPGGCASGGAFCDMLFVIFPIVKSSPFYDPALYDSAAVSYLVHRHDRTGTNYEWGEVIDPAVPAGLSGSMTVKWRQNGFTPVTSYQGLGYALDPGARQLKIRWGTAVPDRASVVVPPVPAGSDACDGIGLTCHNNDFQWGSGT